MGMKSRALGSVGLVALLSLPATAAWGQAAAGASTGGAQLEEIVVTARKRAEAVQSVPISIAAFGAESLEARNIQIIGDVARFTPSVVIDQAASASGGNHSTSIYVRGLGQSDPSAFADPAVATYIDGVYFGRSVGSMQDIVDLDRVEVLKGPQGTLFGKNTMGGAISIVSAPPTGEFGGFAEVSVGRLDQRDVRASVNLPELAKGLALKFTVSSRERDGYTRSLATGQDQDDVNSKVARAYLRWTPNEDVTVSIIADGSRVREAGQGFHLVTARLNPAAPFGGGLSVFNTLPIAAPSTPFQAFDNRWISAGKDFNYSNGLIGFCHCTKIDSFGTSGAVDWAISPNMTLTSITAFRRQVSSNKADLDGSPLDFQGNGNLSHQHQFSEELRLSGDAFEDRLKWLIGAYYLDEKVDETLSVRIGIAGAFRAVVQDNRVRPKTETRAIFTQETFALTDKLSVTAGIRYNYEKKTVPAEARNLITGAFILAPTIKEESWSSWTPKLSLEYQATPDALLYASYSEGFKSGGYDYSITTTAFLPYGPEKVATYELGFKTEWLNRRLRVNGAAFQNDYQDLQLRATTLPGTFNCPATVLPSCSSIVNASTVRIRGAEMEVVARPLPGLDLFANAGYVENKFTKIDPILLATNAANPTNGANFNSKLPRTPKWTVAAGGQYGFEVGDLGRATLGADYSYRSGHDFLLASSPVVHQDGYGLWNARAIFTTRDQDWQFALEGTNLGNRRYINAVLLSTAFNFASVHYGPPDLWSVSVKRKF